MKKKKDEKKIILFPKTKKRVKTIKGVKKGFGILISILNIAIVIYGLYSNYKGSKED